MNDTEPAVARSPAGLALVAAMLAAGAHIGLNAGRLPDSMASHFDMAGRADGFMSREGFLIMYAGVALLIGGMFAIIALALPRIPDGMINVPHREYWLAPERRGATLAWVGRWMLWVGAATVAFIIWVMQLTFAANLGGEAGGQLSLGDSFWWVFGGYMLLLAVACVRLIVRLSRGSSAAGAAGAAEGPTARTAARRAS